MAYIQWKGTEVCMDISCLNCGVRGHFDEEFLYEWTCGCCGQLHEMSSFVRYRSISAGEGAMDRPPILADYWDSAQLVAPQPEVGGSGPPGEDHPVGGDLGQP